VKAMVLRAGALAMEDVATPEPGPGQVLARVLACGICGSDLHAAKFLDAMAEATRRSGGSLWDEDEKAKGIVMGHEFVAEVVRAGPGAEAWEPGTRVTSIPVLPDPGTASGAIALGYSTRYPGAYAEYVILSALLLQRVPDSVPDSVAATTEPCAVGLHAVREARMEPGERALVMGAGPIGLMTLLWLKKEGVRGVAVSEYAGPRRELARVLGADLVIDPAEGDVGGAFAAAFGAAPQVVFECVGVEGTLGQAMELVARSGRVVVVGVCMNEDRIFPMVGINKHLTVQFVLGYTPGEFTEALAALSDGSIDTAPLVTRSVGLADLPEVFASLADPRDCKVVVVPGA